MPRNILPFLHLIERLKTTKRTGWIYKHVQDPESISDHMYRMSIMAMLITDTTIDKDKMIKMCLVHDLAEAIVGDIAPADGISNQEKGKRETDAMKSMVQMLDSSPEILEMESLWNEYEQGTSAEAILVKDLDKFEMIVQAFDYEKRSSTQESLEGFYDSTRDKFRHPQVKQWVQDLYLERQKWKSQSFSSAVLPSSE